MTRAAPEPEIGFPGRLVVAAISLALGFIAGATVSEPWRESDQSSPRVIDLGIEAAVGDDGYPLAPSYGTRDAPMTTAEAAVQHEALIEAWLSPSG